MINVGAAFSESEMVLMKLKTYANGGSLIGTLAHGLGGFFVIHCRSHRSMILLACFSAYLVRNVRRLISGLQPQQMTGNSSVNRDSGEVLRLPIDQNGKLSRDLSESSTACPCVLSNTITNDETLAKHAPWVEEWKAKYTFKKTLLISLKKR